QMLVPQLGELARFGRHPGFRRQIVGGGIGGHPVGGGGMRSARLGERVIEIEIVLVAVSHRRVVRKRRPARVVRPRPVDRSPVDPAIPVMANPTVAPNRCCAPAAICRTTGSLTAPCVLSSACETPSIVRLTSS